MARGPVIGVTFRAGTAEFFEDLTKTKVAVKSFGTEMNAASHSGITGVQATSGALRVLEGGLNNNLRAAERFTANVLGLGPILQAAFPLIGGIAFAGLLLKLGEEVTKFYTGLRDAPEKAKGAFGDLAREIEKSNASLDLSNAKLEQQIAKLEGKHENSLKIMLQEARVAADDLADALAKDLKSLGKVLDETNHSVWHKFFDVKDELTEEIGGETGTGGFYGKTADINDQARERLDAAAKMPLGTTAERAAAIKAKNDAETERNTDLQKAYNEEIAKVTERLRQARAHEEGKIIGMMGGETSTPIMGQVTKGDIERVKNALRQLQFEQSRIGSSIANEDLTNKVTAAQEARNNAKEDAPFANKIADLKVAIAAAGEKLRAAGLDETNKLIAKAEGEALKAIEEVNKAQKRRGDNTPLSKDKEDQIRSTELTLAQVDARAKLAEKAIEFRDRVRDEIIQQTLLNEAIGKGWEAQKKANVEVELMKRFGHDIYEKAATDPMSDEFATVSAGRVTAQIAVEDKHTTAITATSRALANQAAMARVLADAQALGAYAVERAGLEEKIRQDRNSAAGLTDVEAALMRKKFDEDQADRVATEITKINEKVAATDRLSVAILKGADAVRVATLANRIEEANRRDTSGQEAIAAIREEASAHQEELAKTSVGTNRVQKINDEIEKLTEAKQVLGDTLAIEEQLNELENQRIQALVEESLKMRGLQDGVRAFFLEMQEQAKAASNIIYEALNSSLSKGTDNLAKMMVDKKPKGGWGEMWGNEFKGIGESMAAGSMKSLAQKGLGEIGKLFGVDIGHGKPDGSRDNPLWVRMYDKPGGLGASGTHGMEGLADSLPWGKPGDTFGGGARGGGVFSMASHGISSLFSSLFSKGGSAASLLQGMPDVGGPLEGLADSLPFLAGGGDVDPGSSYVVGDKGPEIFQPGVSGRIVPNGGAAGGGGITITNHVDARGADLGAGNRTHRALEATHKASVSSAVQAMHEHAKRMPGK